MKLIENFNQQDFDTWVEGFLPDFDRNVRKVDVPASFTNVKSINTLGESPIGVRVYVIETDADPSRRKVGLATDSFTLLKNYGSPNAIIAYYSKSASLWRISLLTSTPIWSEGKIITKLSNPKRQSYVLGSKAKVKTPHQYLISKGKVLDFNDLKSRFSLEVVNKEFYKEISQAFTQLVGGTVTNGKSKKPYESLLKLPFLKDHSQTNLEFAVRLIGRIIFCWFLREKRSPSGHSLMPKELVSFEASQTIEDYYHKILEPIFFEILNKPVKTRKDSYINELFSAIPYLNGGLFSPHEDDFFSYNEGKQAVNHNMVVVPDGWLKSLFEVLETYNFTIDENTSFDEELSIDPEMLGRIFENLLAEINPETGESARKSTGSYYTPRVIVDYMVDESLYLYLRRNTNILEEKLRSLISYDLDDDNLNPLSDEEKSKITDSLGEIKILDPACGSGAFPIGALQKIVFILQQIDQHGQLWFKKQIKNTPIELRKVIEREFEQRNFDYIRKLGIIRENIYGIDIQPIATEISRLRCFLTLVVDERIDDTLENRGIEPLPNLDFKFVTANTLVGLPTTGGAVNQMGLFEDDQGIKDLKEVRDMFFNASGFERDQLKLQFVQVQNKMFQKLISEGRRGHADLTTKLTTWDPFSHKSASWFDSEWMFGVKDGFDIVIANPPYGADIDDYIDIYSHLYPNTTKGFKDIYKIFIESGIKNLLKENGSLCFIIPNTILLQPRYKDVRKYLLNFEINEIVNLGENVFDQVVVPTCVLLVSKLKSHKSSLKFIDITNKSKWLGSFQILTPEIIMQDTYAKPDLFLFANTIRTTMSDEYELDKIFECKDCGIKYQRVNVGLSQKGNNDLAERLFYEGIKLDPSDEYFLIGKDLSKNGWFIDFSTKRYIRHNYKEILKSNEIVYFNKQFFEEREKIVWRQTSSCFIGTILKGNTWFANTLQAGILREEYKRKFRIEYILGLLNSNYLRELYNNTVKESGRVFPQVKLSKLKTLPIKNIAISEQQPIVDIVNKIIEITSDQDYTKKSDKQEAVRSLEKQLNILVDRLYKLK